MGLLSMLAQLVALGSAIYLGFQGRFMACVGLVALTGIGHFAFSQFADFLMRLHARTRSPAEQEELAFRALSGRADIPIAWMWITQLCGVGYVALIVYATYALAYRTPD